MKSICIIVSFIVILVFYMSNVSAAHYIVGQVFDALDLEPANDKTVILWNTTGGLSDNLTDIIGPNGNSNTNNIYMIDCEMLNNPCRIGDELSIMVIDNGDTYISQNVSVIVTGAGFDIAPAFRLNTPPDVLSVLVDDSIIIPVNEIDLVVASYRSVNCSGTVEEYDTEDLENVRAVFYDSVNSDVFDNDDNNTHYTNNSCLIDSGFGNENQSSIYCNFNVLYNANPGTWKCILMVDDNLTVSGNKSNSTNINELLGISVPDVVNYGVLNSTYVSPESEVNITNYGNVMINLSFSGYAEYIGDGNAMNCSGITKTNISIENQKYNVTATNPGSLSLGAVDLVYKNLSSDVVINQFNLDYRKSEGINEAVNSTYFRIYLPIGINGNCSGNVVIGASNKAS